jgi:hypothetical protein
MKKIKILSLLVLAGVIFSCEKNDEKDLLYDGPSYVSFINSNSLFTAISGESNVFGVEIGVNAVSKSDRTFTVTIAEGSEGTEGVDYTLESKSIAIPAGEVIGKLSIVPDFDKLPTEGGLNLKFELSEENNLADYSIIEHGVSIGKYCTYDVSTLAGAWSGTDGRKTVHYPSQIVVTGTSSSSSYGLTGAAFEWMVDYWGESIEDSQVVNMTVDELGLKVTIPSQQYLTTLYDGDLFDYTIEGTGAINSCTRKVELTYTLTSGDWVGNFTSSVVLP